ncbi:Mitochondrial carrier domain,Mitochondrial substrate/solute carrier [Cinara cedri]|uniref:Mitochondrial carrier domain,Mitochondrial substrate/solute carrier n=1 Tax=Cinara cedri TaxID=506608 RepID=A0A5E4MWU6_9HEMI|nr:Mitochondrial carrier domain,Mitochondrial substrate/solute carrier [Cinara cedri]
MICRLVDMLGSITGGIASALVGQPLDTVKTNMQLYPNLYKNMFSSLYMTGRQQGIRGLYVGCVPALLANSAENAVMVGSYNYCQKLAKYVVGQDKNHNVCARSIESLLTSLVLCPIELVKIRMQGYEDFREVRPNMPSIKLVVKQTLKTDGFVGLYRGLECTLLREFVSKMLFFGLYERCQKLFNPTGGQKEKADLLTLAASGSIAGLGMWLVAYPIDVVKSRVQMSETHTGWPLIRREIQKAGFRGLYSGLWPTLIRMIPVTGMFLFSEEFSKPVYRKILLDTPKNSIDSGNRIFSICDFVSGWTAGIVATFIGYPMDTIRVVQQVANIGPIQSMQYVYNEQKVAGFYRGMMFPLLCKGLVNSILFGISGNVMRLILKFRGTDDIDVKYCCDSNNLNKLYWHVDMFMAGCIGGFFSSAINIPMEVVKTILQASNISIKSTEKQKNSEKIESPKVMSTFKLIVDRYKTGRIHSLYRGGMSLMIRDIPHTGIYFLSYEHFCCVMKKYWYHSETKNEQMPKYIQLVAGGLAGVTSWILVSPLDAIKTKIIVDSQSKKPLYNGMWDCVKKMYAQGGVKIFFRGILVLCIRSFLLSSVVFLVYGILMNMCSEKNDKGTSEPELPVISSLPSHGLALSPPVGAIAFVPSRQNLLPEFIQQLIIGTIFLLEKQFMDREKHIIVKPQKFSLR